MFKELSKKFKESVISVVPITTIVFVLLLIFDINNTEIFIKLLISTILFIIGLSFFTLGADTAMDKLGIAIGSYLSKLKKVLLVVFSAISIGFLITIAEPDLMLLAKEAFGSNMWLLIAIVSLGVGFYTGIAVLRIMLKIDLKYILAVSYIICLALAIILYSVGKQNIVSICFGSGSVTTGPVSVPFLLAFGVGFISFMESKSSDNSFGFIALGSIGPIIAVQILCFFATPGTVSIVEEASTFTSVLLSNIKSVGIVICLLFLMFLVFKRPIKFSKKETTKLLIGFFNTFIGVVLFLTGAIYGYEAAGSTIGTYLTSTNDFFVVLIGLVFGTFAIMAEPAVHVLKKQIELNTSGSIKGKLVVAIMSLGVALAIGLAIIWARHPFNSLYVLVPLYLVCIVCSFINQKLFTAIAYDLGGIAAGAMSVALVSPLVKALAVEEGGYFVTLSFVSSFPILAMQLLGIIYTLKVKKQKVYDLGRENKEFEIIEFDWGKKYTTKEKKQEIIEFDWEKEYERWKKS